MAQFDVHRLTGSGVLVLDCQADLLNHIESRFVVPLLPIRHAPPPMRRLNPVFSIDGDNYVMLTQSAAAVARRELGEVVARLAAEHIVIVDALDFLLSGV